RRMISEVGLYCKPNLCLEVFQIKIKHAAPQSRLADAERSWLFRRSSFSFIRLFVAELVVFTSCAFLCVVSALNDSSPFVYPTSALPVISTLPPDVKAQGS